MLEAGKRKILIALALGVCVTGVYLAMVFTGRADGVEYWIAYLGFLGTDLVQYTVGNVQAKKLLAPSNGK